MPLCHFFSAQTLCYRSGVFWNVSQRIESARVFSLSGFFYLVLFGLSHPTIALTNGDPSKASYRMTWPIFHLISPQQTTRTTVTVRRLRGTVSSVIPRRHLAFYCSPFNPISAPSFVSVSMSATCSQPRPPSQVRRSDSCQWVYWIVW